MRASLRPAGEPARRAILDAIVSAVRRDPHEGHPARGGPTVEDLIPQNFPSGIARFGGADGPFVPCGAPAASTASGLDREKGGSAWILLLHSSPTCTR